MKSLPKIKKLSANKLAFICIITAIIVVNLSIAKYKSYVNSVASTTVALMANDTYVEFSDEIKGYPGSNPKIYVINITNKENNKVCEVSQKFNIKIEREEINNLPIEISLYKDINCTQILEADANGYYEQENFKFQAGEEATKTVYLKINWPEARKNPAYAFEIDYFALHIKSTQID